MKNKTITKIFTVAAIAAVLTACGTKPENTTQQLKLTSQEQFTQKLEQVATLDNVKYKNRELIIGGTTALSTLDATADEDAVYKIVKEYIDENEGISWLDDKRAFSRESISGVRIDDADTVVYHLGFLTKDGYNYVSISDDKITGYSSIAKDAFTEYTRYLCHDVLGEDNRIDIFKIKRCENLIDKDYKEYYLIVNRWSDSIDKAAEYEQSGYEIKYNKFEKSDKIYVIKTVMLPVEEFGNIAYGIRFLNNSLGFACAGGTWEDYPAINVTLDGGDSWQEISFNDIIAPQYFTKYKPCCIEVYGEMIQIRCQCIWDENSDRKCESETIRAGIEPLYIISEDCGKSWTGYVKVATERDENHIVVSRTYRSVTDTLPAKLVEK